MEDNSGRAEARVLVGSTGEELATAYLDEKGYRVLGRNVRTPFGEIDLIARHKDTLVFIEVKTRRSNSFGPPFLSITHRKKKKLVQNALCFISKEHLDGIPWRIDIVSIVLSDEFAARSIELFANAVEGGEW